LCGCGNKTSTPDVEQVQSVEISSNLEQPAYEDSAEVVSDIDESNTMIQETDQSLEIFVALLGAETENGEISVTDEFLNNMEAVYIMGRTGTVAHGFSDDVATAISVMEWEDNVSATREQFEELITLLNLYFGENGQVMSYDNYSEETYVWRDYENTSYVLCWYDDSIINMDWHYDETVKKTASNKVSSADSETIAFTNEYGTPTTQCAHPGCENYIATSGDTNCCAEHSNRCLDCKKYIDEDASYCVECISKAVNEVKSEKHTCEECSKEGIYTITGITGQTEYYCSTHYEELKNLVGNLFGD
jgi:hypothetical protein